MSVRVGVIGCGAIGQRRHIPEAAGNPDVTLVALCDVLKARVTEIAGKYKAQEFTDYKHMLKQADLDAVVVCTPNVFHAPQSIDALNAGKHVLVEKPMAGTREEARAMIKAAGKSGKFLMVGQNQRLMPPHVKAKEILDSRKLGKALTFQTTFKHPGPDSWSVDGAKSWFFRRPEAILGVTGDLGVHKADLMRFLLGEEFSEVSGFVGTLDKKDPKGKPLTIEDNAVFTLKTANGIIGTMTISWTNYGRIEDNGTVIYCENGVIQIGVDPQFGVVVNYRDGNKEFHKVGAMASNQSQTTSGVMDMFIRGIKMNKKPPIDASEGYKSLNVILTAMEAANQGKTLKIPK